VIEDLVRHQAGVVTRAQALACGLSDETIEANVAAGRWRRLFRGVYATFSGPAPRRSMLWAAVLRAGDEAVLSHETAAEIAGLLAHPSGKIHVTVPHSRTPARIPGVVIHRSVLAKANRHPTRTPPQTRVEETVVDLTQTARNVEEAMGWLAKAVGARVTTPARLMDAMHRRPRLRWRPKLASALADVNVGCHSLLELKYYRDVERAHGLPRGRRQVQRVGAEPRVIDDVLYEEYETHVELDGRVAHPDHQRWRDMRRDNAIVVKGRRPLRYGLGDVDEYPCHAAAQLGMVLQLGGWAGKPRRCRRPDCVIA
jgi:Transcriptional regulator, AbiEi antitoxin